MVRNPRAFARAITERPTPDDVLWPSELGDLDGAHVGSQ
jgi:hypothetical protein